MIGLVIDHDEPNFRVRMVINMLGHGTTTTL
jgi:hypothetical protein